MKYEDNPSLLWYLLPLFLSIIGGIIGYFILKNRNEKFAKNILIAGVMLFFLNFLIRFLLVAFR